MWLRIFCGALLFLPALTLFCDYEAVFQTTVCADFMFDMNHPLVLSRRNMILNVKNATGTIYQNSLFHLTDSGAKQLLITYSKLDDIVSGALCPTPNLYSIEFYNNFALPPIVSGMFENCDNLYKLVFDSNTNMQLETLETLHNLKHLYVENQYMPLVTRRYFDGLYNLEVLSLKNDGIEAIESSAFEDLQRMKNLLLDGNEITQIVPDTFASMTHLNILYLYDNRLMHVTGDEFIGLVSLERLTLGKNPIMSIDIDNVLARLPRLRTLGMAYDNLTLEDQLYINTVVRAKQLVLTAA